MIVEADLSEVRIFVKSGERDVVARDAYGIRLRGDEVEFKSLKSLGKGFCKGEWGWKGMLRLIRKQRWLSKRGAEV